MRGEERGKSKGVVPVRPCSNPFVLSNRCKWGGVELLWVPGWQTAHMAMPHFRQITNTMQGAGDCK